MTTLLRWLVWMLVAAAAGILLAFVASYVAVAWLLLSYLA